MISSLVLRFGEKVVYKTPGLLYIQIGNFVKGNYGG